MMKRWIAAVFSVGTFLQLASVAVSEEWAQWRGPQGNNHASDDTGVPTRWDMESGQNVHWKIKIPGRGHSTPIVTDDGIYMTTADNEKGTQALVKVERETGLIVDQWIIHTGRLPRQHSNNSHASPSPAYDGERIFVCFHIDDAIVADLAKIVR